MTALTGLGTQPDRPEGQAVEPADQDADRLRSQDRADTAASSRRTSAECGASPAPTNLNSSTSLHS